ncbi:MAG: YabP/YqfC family sporulation protein [Clostridia bacterium]|nr:YabP/YqfC family sporulation protein [Clostridia bacterium]
MKRKRLKLNKRLIKALNFPEELDPETPKITVLGKSDMLLENHLGVTQYTLTAARLITGQGALRIEGEELQLMELGKDRVYIRGRLKGWEFED